jgi:hypothetical protein
MLSSGALQNLPPTARALINASRDSFKSIDRGHIRKRNDSTFDARARHFTSWLEAIGFTVNNLTQVTVADFPDILATYLEKVADGDNCLSLTNMGDAALRGYLSAASTALSALTSKSFSHLDPETVTSKRPKILPRFSEILRQRMTWKEPRPRKEPFTLAMIDALRASLFLQSKQTSIQKVFLTSRYAAYDWIRLGVFTGSRISEFGQTNSGKPKGQRYATIPLSRDAGIWANQSLAFIADDFIFYSKQSLLVDRRFCTSDAALEHIWELHVRFRFDKSKNNFTIRKYKRLPDAPFDPVIVAINIIRRAHLLCIPPQEPLGQYRLLNKSSNSMLRDSDIRDELRFACTMAYPDPRHYCRIHIKGLVSHSTRVTAALCLKLGGASDEDIAFRLRWHISSVPTYLRECFNGIDLVMQTAIQGVYNTA